MDDYVRIEDITFDSCVDGPGLRTVIWFAGCEHRCPNCHNSQLQPADSGRPELIAAVADVINQSNGKVTLSGGDPLFQIDKVDKMLSLIEKTNSLDIWIYTGYVYDQVSKMLLNAPNIMDKVSVIKCGPFIEDRKNPNIKFRGSDNQKFYKIDDGKIYDITDIVDKGLYEKTFKHN